MRMEECHQSLLEEFWTCYGEPSSSKCSWSLTDLDNALTEAPSSLKCQCTVVKEPPVPEQANSLADSSQGLEEVSSLF